VLEPSSRLFLRLFYCEPTAKTVMQCWWQLSRDGRQSRTQWNNAEGGCTPRCRPLSHSGWE